MILPFDVRKGCAVCAAFFCLPAVAHAQDPYPRLDILACLSAVDPLEPQYRDQLSSQCLAIAGEYCEAEISGPMLACLSDLEQVMVTYAEQNAPNLPMAIVGSGFVAHGYQRWRQEALRAPGETDCQEDKALDRQTCRLLKAMARLESLRAAARAAGLNLP